MGVTVTIAGTGRETNIRAESIAIDMALGGRTTCRMSTTDASWYPVVGQPVTVTHQDGTTVLFTGTIDEVTRYLPNETQAAGVVWSDVVCVDRSKAFDRRLAGEFSWTNERAGVIIRARMAGASMADEGIDTSLVVDGPILTSFSIAYPTFSEFLDSITELCPGYAWTVRPDGKLVFDVLATYPAPFSATASHMVTASVRETREDYFNRVIMRVTNLLRDTATQEFVGNGTAKTFELDYPAGRVSKVRVNELEQTLGLLDVDTGKQWYWSAGSSTITQDAGGTALTSGQTLSVDYQGAESVYLDAVDTAAQTDRETVEGNTGLYEVFRESSDFVTRSDASQLLQALVDANADLSLICRYRTNDFLRSTAKSLRPGQLQTITVSGLGASGSWLIQSVSLTMLPTDTDSPVQWSYDVEAVQGPRVANYVQFFKALGGRGSGGGLGASTQSVLAAGIHYLGGADSITLNLEKGLTQEVLLDRATTDIADALMSGNPPTPGTQFAVIIRVDGTAGRLLTWGTNFQGTGGVSIESEIGSVNIFEFVVMRDGSFLRRNTPAIGVI